MLTKNEYESLKKQLAECNCTYEEKELRTLRKGATGFSHSQFLYNAGTKDLILRDISEIAKAYPGDRFHVEFDGISRFTIIRNGESLMNSDYYEVEECYQTSFDKFHKKLIQAMEIGN